MLSIILLSVIQQSAILLSDAQSCSTDTLSVILLSVIQQSAILLSEAQCCFC